MGSLRRWLETVGLTAHIPAFEKAAIELDILADLSDEDLKELGLPLGDRRRLNKALATMPPREMDAFGTAFDLMQRHPLRGEHRQISTLYCDLVRWMTLAADNDLEDLREPLRRCREAWKTAVAKFDGFVAGFAGDGMIAHFGHPQTHEDDAERAIYAGLAILDAMPAVRTACPSDIGQRLSVRIGIATGRVLVGDIVKTSFSEEIGVLGSAPCFAYRLQGLAEPGSILISDATHRLTKRRFAFETRDDVEIKGVRERVTVHRVLHRIATEQGARRGYADADHPLVGREPETEMLKCRWEAVREGEGQVLIIRGEPGIGKSRLAETVFEDADGPPPVRFRLQCSSYYSKSFLHPFIELISDRAGIEAADRKAVKDEKLTALLQRHGMSDRTPVGVFSELLSIRAKTPQDVAVSSERWKENTLRACSDFLLHVARTRPTQIFVEDAHWADATSLELLDLLVSRIPQLRAMLLVTSRTGPTLRTSSLTHVSSLQLNRLTRGHSIQIVRNVAGDRPLSGALVSQVLERSDGVPLFLEEITKTLINRIGGTAEHGDPGANALEIPVTLEDSLMSRLDRLPSLRETADSASAIGREFSARLVGTVLGLDEEEAHRRLSMLADKGVVFRKDSQYSDTYVFKHALVQDAAYKSMTKARQREMHGRIAAALEDSPSDIAAQSPELLAKHFHEAGNLAKTLDYREAAGRLAIERSATTEAIAHFAEAIRLLEAKNGGAEDQERLTALLTMFGAAQTSVQGYTAPEVIAAYERAWSICEDSGSASSQPEIIYGMWNSAQVGSDYEHAWSLAQMCLSHATAEGDQTALLIANTLCGVTAVLQGRHAVAAGHLEAAVSLYAPDRHSSLATRTGDDPGVESLVFLSLNRWHLGEIDTAVEHAQRSVSLARELAYRHTLIYALSMTGVLLKLRRAPEELMTLADEIVSLSREQEYPYFLEWGNNLKGWALCELGRAERGLSMMSNVWKQGFSSLLFAEGCIKAGYPERGLAVIDTVIASQPCYAADALRIKGQLLLAEDRTHRKAAIDCFHQALRLAREQGANQYVLRAAVSLARHASTEDEAHVARTALHDVVDTIKAPSGCIDLTEAREFLKATAPG